jgi:hypothetical protein
MVVDVYTNQRGHHVDVPKRKGNIMKLLITTIGLLVAFHVTVVHAERMARKEAPKVVSAGIECRMPTCQMGSLEAVEPKILEKESGSQKKVADESNGLKAELAVEKQTIKYGETVRLTLTLENTTDKDIQFYAPPAFHTNTDKDGLADGSFITATDSTGKTIAHEQLSFGGALIGLISKSVTQVPKKSKKEVVIELHSGARKSSGMAALEARIAAIRDPGAAPVPSEDAKRYLTFGRHEDTKSGTLHAIPFVEGTTNQLQFVYSNEIAEEPGYSKDYVKQHAERMKKSKLDAGARKTAEVWHQAGRKANNLWKGSLASKPVAIVLVGDAK